MAFLVSCLWGFFISTLKDVSNHMDYSIERYKQFLAFRSSLHLCFKHFIPLSLNSESVSIYFGEFNSAKEGKLVTCQLVCEYSFCYQQGVLLIFTKYTLCKYSNNISLQHYKSVNVCSPINYLNKHRQWRHHCPSVWVVLWLEPEMSPPWVHALNSWSSAHSILLRDFRNAGRWELTGRVEEGCLEQAFEVFSLHLALCFMASTMPLVSATDSCGVNWVVSTVPSSCDWLKWDLLKSGAQINHFSLNSLLSGWLQQLKGTQTGMDSAVEKSFCTL